MLLNPKPCLPVSERRCPQDTITRVVTHDWNFGACWSGRLPEAGVTFLADVTSPWTAALAAKIDAQLVAAADVIKKLLSLHQVYPSGLHCSLWVDFASQRLPFSSHCEGRQECCRLGSCQSLSFWSLLTPFLLACCCLRSGQGRPFSPYHLCEYGSCLLCMMRRVLCGVIEGERVQGLFQAETPCRLGRTWSISSRLASQTPWREVARSSSISDSPHCRKRV